MTLKKSKQNCLPLIFSVMSVKATPCTGKLTNHILSVGSLYGIGTVSEQKGSKRNG